MRWDPRTYSQFNDERSRPFFDLVGQIRADAPRRVVDLGCGTGELTATLADRWPGATVTGIDNSPEMIERAHTRSGNGSALTFETGDIVGWRMEPGVDVVVSNAALQWVPTHRELIRQWARVAGSGAWLAWQVPGNFNAPSHVLMRELAASPQWADKLAGVLRHEDAVSEPAGYLALLTNEGFAATAWETTYLHILPGDDPVLEWVRSSGLRPVLTALNEEDSRAFEAEYAALLRVAYPKSGHGTIFPFRRIFCAGQKL